jgi:hypothetical protein
MKTKMDDDKRIMFVQDSFGLNMHNAYMTHTIPTISVSTVSIFFIVTQLCNINQRKAQFSN